MAVAPKITADLLKKRRKLDEEQKELERQARAVAKQKTAIDTDLKAELVRVGKTSIARGGYRVSIVDGRPTVSWKTEFIKISGAQMAVELEEAAPRSQRLEVTEETPRRAA